MNFKAVIICFILTISASIVAYIIFEREFKESYLIPCKVKNSDKNDCFADYVACPFCEYLNLRLNNRKYENDHIIYWDDFYEN